MNDQHNPPQGEKGMPSCNVNQTFNYGVGAVALLAAAAIYYFLIR